MSGDGAAWTFGVVVGPELPACVCMLLQPVGEQFVYDDLLGHGAAGELVAERAIATTTTTTVTSATQSFRVSSKNATAPFASNNNVSSVVRQQQVVHKVTYH